MTKTAKKQTPESRVLKMARTAGVLRARDLDAKGLPRRLLSRLCEEGDLERIARGLYVAANAPVTEHHSAAQVSKRVPGGIVCLLSALRFHGLTTQQPSHIWLAIDRKARLPKERGLPIRIVRFSGPALTAGIEEHRIEGVRVRVYNPAKTVADCFKYRQKIGIDVAVEALRGYLKKHRGGVDALWRFAGICRVQRVMQPYLESVA